jgi:hypothetical protein
MENENIQERQASIDGVRQMLDFLEANPDIPWPQCLDSARIRFYGIRNNEKEIFIATARAFGTFDKEVVRDDFEITKHFGPAKLTAVIDRSEVCTKRTVMKTVLVEEWDCQPLLIDGKTVEEAVEEVVTV